MTSRSKGKTPSVDPEGGQERKFGAAAGKPPSWFSRVPTAAIWAIKDSKGKDKINYLDLKVLAVMCAYVNNQGICFVGQERMAKAINSERSSVARSISKWVRLGHVSVISRYRSEWKGVFGNVYRVIYDKRLSDQDVIDAMDREPAKDREDPPIPSPPATVNHIPVNTDKELAGKGSVKSDARRLAQWYVGSVNAHNGQLRLVNERAVAGAEWLLQDGWAEVDIKYTANHYLEEGKAKGSDAPHHLGFLRGTKPVSKS